MKKAMAYAMAFFSELFYPIYNLDLRINDKYHITIVKKCKNIYRYYYNNIRRN